MRNPRKRELWVFNPKANRNGIKKTSTVTASSTSSVHCHVNKKMPVITRAQWKQVNSSGVPDKVVEREDCVSAIKVERNKTKKEKDTKKSKKKNSHRKEKSMKNKVEVKGKVSKKIKKSVQLLEKAPLTFKDDVEEEERNDDFEKTLEHDITSVLARQVVDKDITFTNDQDEKITCFRRKITRAIRRADILKLKGSLTGEVVHYPRDLVLPNFSHSTLAAVETVKISTSKSMNLDQDMPLIPSCVEKPLPGARCKKNFRQEKKPIKPKVQLKPLDFLSVKKTTNFKIPKKGKEKVPRWVINGSLWQKALTVDDNGQVFRYLSWFSF